MNITKWSFVTLGMLTLFCSLNVQTMGIIQNDPSSLSYAALGYILGALLLIAPPVIESKTAKSQEKVNFAWLLIVLQVFLVGSGLLFYWDGVLVLKILVRIAASVVVTAYLKYGLKQLPLFQWSFLYNPVAFLRYHWDCLRGRYGPAYPLSLGIDWLGLGYAFLAYPFGKGALFVGSVYLLVSAWRGYKETRAAIPLAWSVLNFLYVSYGAFFFVHALLYA